MFPRIFSFLLLFSACFSQTPADLEKAPPDVEEALRARIGKFYQAHVDGKFRLAYELVAEDSKDYFFAADKQQYSDYSIVKIEYSENFTKAKAVVACGKTVDMVGNRLQVKAPMVSNWKLIDGQWYWYMIPTSGYETPFGTMRPGPTVDKSKGGSLGKQAPALAALQKMVKVDKREVKLSCTEPSSDQVVVSNHLPGSVSLSIDSRPPALEISFDRPTLKAEETATITFRCNPAARAPKPTVIARLRVSPTNQAIPIRVTFSGPRPQAAEQSASPPAPAPPQ